MVTRCRRVRLKGLSTLPARISKVALCPPTLNVIWNRSGPMAESWPSSIRRKKAQGPSLTIVELGLCGWKDNRTCFGPVPGHCIWTGT
jgi:hypothetical protein